MRLLLYGVSRRMEATVASGVWLRVGARMIDAFGLRRIIVAGGFGVIGSSFVHYMVREDPARR